MNQSNKEHRQNGFERFASLINVEHLFTVLMLTLIFGVFSTWRSVEKLQWEITVNSQNTGQRFEEIIKRFDRTDGEIRKHEERLDEFDRWRLLHNREK